MILNTEIQQQKTYVKF